MCAAPAMSFGRIFRPVDVNDAVAARLADLPARLPAMRIVSVASNCPTPNREASASTPYDCEFWDRCIANKPADWIAYLPRLSQASADQLKALGIEAISSIPSDFPLTSKQVIIRDAMASGQPYRD